MAVLEDSFAVSIPRPATSEQAHSTAAPDGVERLASVKDTSLAYYILAMDLVRQDTHFQHSKPSRILCDSLIRTMETI